LNTTLTPHSIMHGDACFAYFNKIWGIPPQKSILSSFFQRLAPAQAFPVSDLLAAETRGKLSR
jgi:hypothetical protein